MRMRETGKRMATLLTLTLALALLPPAAVAGNLEPSAPPGPTMKTLDDIPGSWSRTIPSNDRFLSVIHSKIFLDRETGLVWSNHLMPGSSWQNAQFVCFRQFYGGKMGWRLPSIEEITSLVVDKQLDIYPFSHRPHISDVLSAINDGDPKTLWTATEDPRDAENALAMSVNSDGFTNNDSYSKTQQNPFVCVRGVD
jgi:hypothetical protein